MRLKSDSVFNLNSNFYLQVLTPVIHPLINYKLRTLTSASNISLFPAIQTLILRILSEILGFSCIN